MGTKFEAFSLMIRDPFDERLPLLARPLVLQHPYSGRQIMVNTSIGAEKYRENALIQKKFAREMFRRAGIDVLELNTNREFIIPLVSFLKQRAKGEAE
jgi:hypothetical protein